MATPLNNLVTPDRVLIEMWEIMSKLNTLHDDMARNHRVPVRYVKRVNEIQHELKLIRKAAAEEKYSVGCNL